MNTDTLRAQRGCALATAVALALAPATALADTPSGTDLLLPKMSEYIPALIAFIVIFVVLKVAAWPSILGILEKRQEKIQSDLDEADRAKRDAQADRKRYGDKLMDLSRENESLREAAIAKANAEAAQIVADANAEAAQIRAAAAEAVAEERRHAMDDMSETIVDLSVDIASKIIGEALPADEQRKLAERYLAEVDGDER